MSVYKSSHLEPYCFFWLVVKEVVNQDLAAVKDRHPRVDWLVEKQIAFSHVDSGQVVGKENVH